MSEIRFKYTPTFRDSFCGSFAAISRTPFQLLLLSVFPLIGVVTLVLATQLHGAPRTTDVLITLLCLGFSPIIVVSNIVITFIRARGIDLTQHYEIGEHGLIVNTALAKLEINWSTFKQVKETSNFIIFHYKPGGVLVIPKSALIQAGVLSEFIQYVEHKLEGNIKHVST